MATAHNTLVPSAISPVIISTKTCTACHADKPFSEFGPHKSGKHGVSSQCKRCFSVKTREYRHGLSPAALERHHLRQVRFGMIDRCYKPESTHFKHYGGRGIAVCKRWLDSFDDFLADMGPRPTGYQIDRTDNDAGYSPENCRWVTPAENSQNRRIPSNNTTGIAGVFAIASGGYRASIARSGIVREKNFNDFFEACCWRKSREINFRGNAE